MGMPQPWPLEALWEQMLPLCPGLTLECWPEIDSSNSELMRRARAGQHDPVLLVAERQSAGRGRVGRQWWGQPGDTLMFSLGLPLAPADWSGLSLALGLALAEALHPQLQLKWPNDLWWQQRKLGGLLIEVARQGAHSQLVVGVGLNVQAPPAEGLRTAPAALREFWPEASAPLALARVALPLLQAVLAFEREGLAPLLARYAQRDALQGRPIVTSDGRSGVALGIDPRGALRWRPDADPAQEQLLHSEEVSVRPQDLSP